MPGAASITVGQLGGIQLRAFVVFNGSGVISAQQGVSGVVRNSVGNFTISFSPAMPNANYVVLATPNHNAVQGSAQRIRVQSANTTSCVIECFENVTATDWANVHVSFNG